MPPVRLELQIMAHHKSSSVSVVPNSVAANPRIHEGQRDQKNCDKNALVNACAPPADKSAHFSATANRLWPIQGEQICSIAKLHGMTQRSYHRTCEELMVVCRSNLPVRNHEAMPKKLTYRNS